MHLKGKRDTAKEKVSYDDGWYLYDCACKKRGRETQFLHSCFYLTLMFTISFSLMYTGHLGELAIWLSPQLAHSGSDDGAHILSPREWAPLHRAQRGSREQVLLEWPYR